MDPIVSAVTQVLLQEVYRSLKDQSPFVFKYEFDQMKKKLKLMKGFLADAQLLEKKHRDYMTMATSFSALRDLVYDVDDIILDCQIRASYEEVFPIRRFTPRGYHFYRIAENRLKEIIKHIEIMENQFQTYLHQMNIMIQGRNKEPSPSANQISRISSLSVPVGLEEDTQKILSKITTDEKSCQIAIVGMGGSGKTTIALKIFDDTDVVKYFDERIWVTVSQTFREEDVLGSMLKQVRVNDNMNVPQSKKWSDIFTRSTHKMKVDDSVPADDYMSLICQSLTNKKYLIVMDDVWTMNCSWWKKLIGRLPKGERCKNSIIITTRNELLARDMGATYIHKAPKLGEDESWHLFRAIAFPGNVSTGTDAEFQRLGMNIVEKCVGLPLAIKTMAEYLSTKSHSPNQWKKVCTNFPRELENQKTVHTNLRLSYDDLPVVLKHCIMCFAVHPEGTEINAEQLVYWWVSEGFVQENGPNTAVEVAFQCLRELVSRFLVESVEQRGYDGRVYKCKMHSMVRDLIIKISRDEKFCSFDQGSKNVPDGDSRHLGYTSGMDLELLKENYKLRSFLLMGKWSFTFHPALATIKSLRVLDLSNKLEDHVRIKDLLRWVKSQKRLAYLNLEGVDDLEELPDWIKKRQNLKILIMKDCKNLKELPPKIIYLKNLVVLDVRNCPLELPQGFGSLTSIQVLYGFKLTKQGRGSRYRELESLINLRVLGIDLSEKDEIADGEGYVLRGLPRLKVLYINTKNCERNYVALVNKIMPPPALEELHLCSYHGDSTPYWLEPSTLPELLYLSVSDSRIASVSPRFWKTRQKPWKIEGLFLKNLPRFKLHWGVLGIKMEYLRHVEVSCCQSLTTFPLDVKNHDVWEREGR